MTSTRGSLTRRVRAAGKRMTRERELILGVIEANRHLDATEICRLASRKDPRLNASTVYRTMTLLREMGLVDSSPLGEDHDHYEARGDAHHHAVCLGCGRIIEIPTERWIADLARREQFRVTSAKVELLGYCAACQAGLLRASSGRQDKRPSTDAVKTGTPRGSGTKGPAGVAQRHARTGPTRRGLAASRRSSGRDKNA